MRGIINEVKHKGKRIVFPEGDHPKVLMAVSECIRDGICVPILLGDADLIEKTKEELLNFIKKQAI